MLGGFYFKERAGDRVTANQAIGLSPPLATAGAVYAGGVRPELRRQPEPGRLRQLDFEVVPRLSVTVGGRYTSDKKTFTSINVRQRDLVQSVNVTKNATFEKFTPRLSVNYKASEDVLMYAFYSRGFKRSDRSCSAASPTALTAGRPSWRAWR